MSLVMRFRDENVRPVEQVLVENVEKDVSYKIVCRVEWDVIPRGQSRRDRVSVWINPGEEGDKGQHAEFIATSGSPETLSTIYLLQRRYGGDVHDALFVDDIWLGAEFFDCPGSK